MKSAFILSFKNSILTLPLFLPVINLIFGYFYLKELKEFSTKRWDELSSEQILPYEQKRKSKIFLISTALVLSCLAFAPQFSLNQISKVPGIELLFEGASSRYRDGNIANWSKVDEDAVKAILYFPQKPEYITESFAIPKSSGKLDLNHYTYSDAAHQYSLTHTSLPSSWTKWGASLVLNVGINHVVDKKAIVYKKKCKHHNFPALEYKLKQNGKVTTGMLVLVKDRMYKIEFQQNEEIASLSSEAENNLLNAFFSSFKPHSS